MVDNTLAMQIKPFDLGNSLARAAQVNQAQQETQAAQFKLQQQEMGSEARGLTPFVNTPEFPQRWAESIDRLSSKGMINPQMADQMRKNPSPLMLKSIISQTSDPALDFQREQATRQQSNTDRTFNEGVRQFNLNQQPKPSIQHLKQSDGSEKLVRIESDNSVTPLADNSDGSQPNPFSYGKMNETQSKDAGYANRMFRAEGVLRDPKVVEAGTSFGQSAIENAPGTILGLNVGLGSLKNWAHTPEYQKYDQASRDFINAVLRRESGAAISQSEFDNAYVQYLPKPGDSKEKLAEKQKNRQTTLASIAGGGGPSYKPPFTFDPNGEMQPTGNAGQGVKSSKPSAAGMVPPEAAAALKKNPKLKSQFDAKYGAGASDKILGGE